MPTDTATPRWLYVPRGCAVLYVPLRNQHLIRSTLPTSHGFIPQLLPGEASTSTPLPAPDAPKTDFEVNFEFVGTANNAPYLCIPAAIAYRRSLGGEARIRDYVNGLAKRGGRRAAEILGTEVMGAELDARGEARLGECAFANVRLPMDVGAVAAAARASGGVDTWKGEALGVQVRDWMSRQMMDDYDTFMAVMFYGGQWWCRMSGQVYLEESDFVYGAEVLKRLAERVLLGEVWR